jgi:hypothetical protein
MKRLSQWKGREVVLEECKEYLIFASFLVEVAEWRIDGETDLCVGKIDRGVKRCAATCRTSLTNRTEYLLAYQ